MGERRIRVEFQDGLELKAEEFDMDTIGDNERFLQLLRRYPIETVHSRETTLEQIFIDVTGRQLV